MNNEPTEVEETYVPTSDVLTDDGITITPTRSTTKMNWFDVSASFPVLLVALLVLFGVCVTWAFHMGMGLQKNEITSTTYTQSGACHHVEYFMVSGMDSGERPDLFAKYQAEHPNESPSQSRVNHGCPIAFENNSQH